MTGAGVFLGYCLSRSFLSRDFVETGELDEELKRKGFVTSQNTIPHSKEKMTLTNI